MRITLHEEQIAKLTMKIEKRAAQSSTKTSESEDSEKVSIHTAAFNNEKQPKKEVTPKMSSPLDQ